MYEDTRTHTPKKQKKVERIKKRGGGKGGGKKEQGVREERKTVFIT